MNGCQTHPLCGRISPEIIGGKVLALAAAGVFYGLKMKKRTVFTSESVCSGHPDKICDQVSDAIVDAVLKKDKFGRVAVEALVTKNKVVLAGEVSCNSVVDFEGVARKQIKRLGYINPDWGFSNRSDVEVYIHKQSSEIAVGVDDGGAGDQGMMFGYACKETPEFMPMPIVLAHKLARAVDEARQSGELGFLRPDGKSQVSVEYEGDRPVGVLSVVLAVPHGEKTSLDRVKEGLYEVVVKKVLKEYGFRVNIDDLVVNGTGVWHLGGPGVDTGVTGRKIVVDTYGGYARVGGGCFSGKDPTKVDRSGAYAARFLAKNIVAGGLADKCEVRLAYFIGAKKPLMQEIETFGTAKVSSKKISAIVSGLLDLSVKDILEKLSLRRPIYLQTASYGHFGRNEFPWEEVRGS